MRAETRIAIGSLLLFGALLILVQSRGRPRTSLDPRRSTFLHGPEGAAGLADVLRSLGIRVEIQRRRYATLKDRADSLSRRTMFAVLDPAIELERAEGIQLAEWPRRHGDLLLSGAGSDQAMACFGYRAVSRDGDTVEAHPPGNADDARPSFRVGVMLARHLATEMVDSGGSALTLSRCLVPQMASAETLLVTSTGRAVAIRLHPVDYSGTVTLVADGAMFSNQSVRDEQNGVFTLGLIAGRDTLVIFDERHQGFGPTGSLFGAALDWSRSAPIGWALWQLIAVGLLVLLFGAVRFGPPRPLNDRRRRSALEHVTALATALAAANGHDTAIRLMIRGLGQRLTPGRRAAAAPRELLARLGPIVRTPQGRSALRTLQSLTRPGQPAGSVLIAANAVEDVWQDLRP